MNLDTLAAQSVKSSFRNRVLSREEVIGVPLSRPRTNQSALPKIRGTLPKQHGRCWMVARLRSSLEEDVDSWLRLNY